MGHDVRDEVGRVDGKLDRTTTNLWILVGGLVAGVFAGAYGFRTLHRRSGDHSVRLTHIDQAQRAVRNEGIQLDSKLIEVLEKQLHLLAKEREGPTSSGGDDHSLSPAYRG